VGFTVPENTAEDGEIRIMELPAGEYAVGTFELSPDEYGMAWEELYGFIQSKRLIPAAGPVYESYKNEPHEHPDGKQVVDICVALKG
jgi:AraC family transcriptional regulator